MPAASSGRMNGSRLVRNYYVLPCCLLLLNLVNSIISYKAQLISDHVLRVAFIMVMILGGSGLVGHAVARRLLAFRPKQIVLVALYRHETEATAKALAPHADGRPVTAREIELLHRHQHFVGGLAQDGLHREPPTGGGMPGPQQQRAQQQLGGDRRPAHLRVQLVELRRERRERLVGEHGEVLAQESGIDHRPCGRS